MRFAAPLAVLLALAAPAVAQTHNIEDVVTGGVLHDESFLLPLAGTPSVTFISIVPVRLNPGDPIVPATYSIRQGGFGAFTVVPTTGSAAIGAIGQVTFHSPTTPEGRAVIRINHNNPLGGSQPWTLRIDTGAAPATVFYGKVGHAEAPTQDARWGIRIGGTTFCDNAAGTTSGLGAASLAFGKASFNASRNRTVTVINTGTANLTLGAITDSADPTGFYTVTAPAAGTVIGPNLTQDFTVTYTPVAPPAPPAPPHAGTLAVPSSGGPATANVALTGEAAFREIVLCIDASNSMNWANDGTPLASCPPASTMAANFDPDSRIRQVRAALQTFQSRLNVYGDGQTHLAIVRFPGADLPTCPASHSDALASAPSTWVTTGPAVSLYNSGSSTLAADILSVTNAGFYHSTPMKQGLIESLARFSSVSGPSRAIILLSDGFHNVPAPPESPADVLPSLIAKPCRVYPVGFGTSGSVDHPLLQSLATGTSGEFLDATAGGDLTTYYNKIFTNFMELDTAVDPPATVAPGAKNVHPALVCEHDALTTFTVSWTTPTADLLDVVLIAPDGRRFHKTHADVRYQEGPKHKSYTLDLANSRRKPGKWIGEWKLEVELKARDAAVPEKYTYDVVMRSDLELRTAFDKTAYFTGDRVVLTARLAERGMPMTGRTVVLQVRKPGESPGDWHATNPATAAAIEDAIRDRFGATSSAAVEQLTGIFKKTYYLTKVKGIPLPPHNPAFPAPGFAMRDDGQGGDLVARDGVYTAVLDGLLTEAGNYAFFVTATGKTSGQNDFRRESEQHRHVELRIDPAPAQTSFVVQPIEGAGGERRRFRVKVTPKDKFGNLLGPGHGRSIDLRVSAGRALGDAVEDDLNGNYTRDFEVEGPVAPVVVGSVKGVPLPEQLGPAGSTSTGGTNATLSLLLALLLAALLILVLTKCCRK
jgi:hypothetical protein